MLQKRKTTAILAMTFAASLATAALVQAQTVDKRTIYTFSGPVELPGVSLAAGQYVFKLADPDTGRQVARVTSVDGKEVYGTFFFIPIQRPEVSNEPEVRFMEVAAGAPPAIRASWYPGDRTGWEFIYPREQAMRLARSAKDPVLTTVADSTKIDEGNSAETTRVSGSDQSGAVAENRAADSPAPDNRSDTRAAAETPVGTSGRAPAAVVAQNEPRATPPPPAPAPPRDALPQTASPQGVIGLAGLCLIGAAAGLRLTRSFRAPRVDR